MQVHRKSRVGAPPGFFPAEAAGLRWLAQARGAPVVEVLDVDEHGITLEHLTATTPGPGAAADLGVGLARMHDAAAPSFGCLPPGGPGVGYFGPLEAPHPLHDATSHRWGEAHAEGRVLPVRDLLAAQGALDRETGGALDRLAERLRDGEWDDGDPPARLHGDLWAGNVLWTARGAVLIDPAAHGGHRLTDLAMLALFGLPHLDTVLAAYQEVHVLPSGWPELLALHQVFPVGMHAVIFGGGYLAQLREIVSSYV